jgi:hypothetical protein
MLMGVEGFFAVPIASLSDPVENGNEKGEGEGISES